MSIYHPEIAEKINVKFITNNPNLSQPWSKLNIFYLKFGNNLLYIPANTQLSEFLNKFNESDILPRLGEYKLNEINFGRSKMPNPDFISKDFGWNWINWNTNDGKRVYNKLLEIFNGKKFLLSELDRATLKILGRLKLKDSTDYGIKVEEDFNNFLEQRIDNIDNFSIETKEIFRLLNDNDYVVIAYKSKFVNPQGLMCGEIDYLLMNKQTKKLHIADLKTSSTADTYDYWRQLSIYYLNFLILNPHLRSHLSPMLVIIHVNNMKEKLKSNLYIQNINDNLLLNFASEALKFRENYLRELLNWRK